MGESCIHRLTAHSGVGVDSPDLGAPWWRQDEVRRKKKCTSPLLPMRAHLTNKPTNRLGSALFTDSCPIKPAQKTGDASKEQATRLPQLLTLRGC